MDRQGVDIEALSINPFWYRTERDMATEIVRIHNETLAEMCGKYPDRLVAFASLALQFPDLAVQQLEHGVKKLGLRGAAVGASCAGEEFSDAKFHPVWAKAEELGVLIFIHPQSTPELAKRFKGNGWLANTIGNPLDTTICLSHLIFEGTLDRFPDLKICCCARRRLPAFVRAALRPRLPRRALALRREREAEEEADGVHEDDVLRHAGLHLGDAAAPRRRGRRRASSSSAPIIRYRGTRTRSPTS